MENFIVKYDLHAVEERLISHIVCTPIQKKSFLCSTEMVKLLEDSPYFQATPSEAYDSFERLIGTFCGCKVFYNAYARASENFIRNEANEKIVKISFEGLDSFDFDSFT